MGRIGGVNRGKGGVTDACWTGFDSAIWAMVGRPRIRYFRLLISCDCHEAWLAEGCGCRWMAPLGSWSPLAAHRKFADRRVPTIKIGACKIPETGTRYAYVTLRRFRRFDSKGTLHKNDNEA